MTTRGQTKRARGETNQSQSSRTQGARQNAPENPYGIIFRDDAQRKKYDILATRRILNTRYMNFFALQDLGLIDDIRWMSDNVGWTRFIELKSATYIRLVLEFLSSVTISFKASNEGLTFRLMNTEYALTLNEFNGIYGFPTEKNWIDISIFNSPDFLGRITGDRYATLKATNVHNPCFRYMQRFMAHTIFGRGDSDGVFRRDELFIIHAMMTGATFDTGVSILRHWKKHAGLAKGDIVFGGLITPIATHFRIDCTRLLEAQGSNTIDVDSCIAMHMIIKQNDRYFLSFKNNWRLPLPHPRTSVRDPVNWTYPEAQDDYEADEDFPHDQQAADDRELEEEMQFYPGILGPGTSTAGHGGAGSSRPPRSATSTTSATLARIEQEQAAQHTMLTQQHALITHQHELITQQQEAMAQQTAMMQRMYDWHISQGHFGPPPS